MRDPRGEPFGPFGQVVCSIVMFPVAVLLTGLYVVGLLIDAFAEGWRRTGY